VLCHWPIASDYCSLLFLIFCLPFKNSLFCITMLLSILYHSYLRFNSHKIDLWIVLSRALAFLLSLQHRLTNFRPFYRIVHGPHWITGPCTNELPGPFISHPIFCFFSMSVFTRSNMWHCVLPARFHFWYLSHLVVDPKYFS
jgi:hypothetical protein